jgi:hypothetical protein
MTRVRVCARGWVGGGAEEGGYLVAEEQGDEVGDPAVEGAGDAAHQRDGVQLGGGEARHCEGRCVVQEAADLAAGRRIGARRRRPGKRGRSRVRRPEPAKRGATTGESTCAYLLRRARKERKRVPVICFWNTQLDSPLHFANLLEVNFTKFKQILEVNYTGLNKLKYNNLH